MQKFRFPQESPTSIADKPAKCFCKRRAVYLRLARLLYLHCLKNNNSSSRQYLPLIFVPGSTNTRLSDPALRQQWFAESRTGTQELLGSTSHRGSRVNEHAKMQSFWMLTGGATVKIFSSVKKVRS